MLNTVKYSWAYLHRYIYTMTDTAMFLNDFRRLLSLSK